MRRGPKRRWLALGALTGSALLATAGVAMALSARSATQPVPTQSARAAAVSCRQGSEAVSGGFADPGFDPSGQQIYTVNSKRKGERTRKELGFNASGIADGAFTDFVYCAKLGPGLKVASASAPIASHQLGSTTAKCPRGSEAVSGGFSTPSFDPAGSGPRVITYASKRVRVRKWRASAYNDAFSDGTLKAYAYCDRHQPGLKERSKDATITQDTTGSAKAKCPRGSEAVSGGFDGHLMPTSIDAMGAYPFTSKRIKTRVWKASGYAYHAESTITAFAYCER